LTAWVGRCDLSPLRCGPGPLYCAAMAGHSKWANIQHRKGKQDAARGKLFSKLAREITVAARMGDPDPAMNPRLRLAVDTAKAASMRRELRGRAVRGVRPRGRGGHH